MRKRNLFFALAAGMVMFSACSNDDDFINEGNNNLNEEVQQLVLQVASSGDGLQTRAGRPLYSAEAKQAIENIKLLICDGSNTIVQDTLITNWNSESDLYTDGGHGQKMTIMLQGRQKLQPGTYSIYAFGYSSDSEYTGTDGSTTIANLLKTYGNGVGTDGQTSADETVKTYNPQTSPLTLKTGHDEIFAGSVASLTIEAKKGINQPVVLHRQVAGAFAYVKDIPFIEGAAKLRLMATNKSTDLILDKFLTSELANNGNNASSDVVNGYTANATTSLQEVAKTDLSNWFNNVKDNNGVLDVNEWKANDNYEEGSVFLGDFIVPFKKNTAITDAGATFILQLTDENDNVLRSWIVKLPANEKATTVNYWNGTAWATESDQETVNHYSVMRNHLYGIGHKMADEGTDGPDPENPDPDKPESLNTKQELTLRVNDNWEVIHGMEIE